MRKKSYVNMVKNKKVDFLSDAVKNYFSVFAF
jgi:hypothetical protein